MVKRVFGVILVTLAGVGTMVAQGCGDDTSSSGEFDCSTVKGFSELSGAFSKCTNCHATTLTDAVSRQSAPEGFDYDTYEAASQFPDAIVEQVEDDEMPIAPSPALSGTEKTDMLTWASCGTPP